MDLSHFEKGTAIYWGIADEYPQDGTHLATHPWDYDTLSRQFRTWFDVRDGSNKKGTKNISRDVLDVNSDKR
jgi:hypothetical protein